MSVHAFPGRRYVACAGEIIAADGRRVEFIDAPDLVVAHASQALQLHAYGRIVTAKRFAHEALALDAAYQEAKRWRAASGPISEGARA